jgi:hypothetical protein
MFIICDNEEQTTVDCYENSDTYVCVKLNFMLYDINHLHYKAVSNIQ